MPGTQAEAALRTGQEDYRAKRYKHALEQFTRAMRLCKCNRGLKRDRCACKNFEAVVEKNGSIFHEAMYTCTCPVGKTFNKCDNPVHIKALDYRAATFESLKELDRARRDAEWILELAPRFPDGYLRLGKIARLQKKDEFAWKVYSAGVDAGSVSRMTNSPKFQQLYSARSKLHLRFCRKDPVFLPSELFIWILSYCNLRQRVRCQRVSKQWQRTITSRDFASLWKDLDFTGPSTPRRPPRIDFLKKLVASAGRDVRRIVIEEKNHRFQLSQAKLFALLMGASRLEHLELSFPDHTLKIPPTAGLCKTLKTLSLRLFTAEPKKSIVGLDYISVSAYPFELLNPVAETIETLHLSGLPMSWFREQDVPLMPKLKNLHLQMRPGSTAMCPILHVGTKTPALEQLWLQDTLPDRSNDWEDQWSKLWPNFKGLVVAGGNSSTAARFATTLIICLFSSLNHGHKLEYIDLDLPWSPNPDAIAIEPLTLNPGPAIQKLWNMTGTPLDPENNWRNEYKSLKAIRLANAVLDPESLQQVAQDQAAAGQLDTLDIVFPPDSLASPAGAASSAHLAKYAWLAGAPGLRCMALSHFRFRSFPRTPEDLPLPTFLATFPELETLEIRSDHYEEPEMCSVISAIIKETKTIKVIYQNQIRGALMDGLGAAAAKHGVSVVFGERPREWPVRVTSS
ncbi:Tetratricopeptide-like helical [Cordyceps fumosorosea ARSEF 2679]|uniref:Tetratricopeptide-like helical n=1 Tax=Cordyceps fumosorosea (strain ARSEF 2679) TaxID=1081104 RepID=A0A167QJA4_CORFA|nr:Tetratricopeptide-like helical [Cordyceps fumosorosea ARSEF 2679]OAA57692.1 Tetratricopeptide-like helical [Cordyceps fumosorosea ARSEF 2679]